jgi:type 1 fimbriae regulatory protein FimB/type 1 fimbriae regulatory protein FimE
MNLKMWGTDRSLRAHYTKRTREHLTPDEIEKLFEASKIASRNPERDYCMLLLVFRHGLQAERCGPRSGRVSRSRLKRSDDGVHPFYNASRSLSERG